MICTFIRRSWTFEIHLCRAEGDEIHSTSVEKGLKGGVVYHDGQFDCVWLSTLAQTCGRERSTVVNEATVTAIVMRRGKSRRREVRRQHHRRASIPSKARNVVNAAVFVDDIKDAHGQPRPQIGKIH